MDDTDPSLPIGLRVLGFREGGFRGLGDLGFRIYQ